MNSTNKTKGTMLIISAPSGAGKTTLCRHILGARPTIRSSVSYTTRKPREGEIDGVDYSFIVEKDFRKMIEEGEFAEWAEVHGNLYGTSRRRLQELMDEGFDVLLDIDVQGAKQIKKTCEGGVYIFILPPSLDVLRSRLAGRGSNTAEDMERRLGKAVDEIREYRMYDYVIVNNILEQSTVELETVIAAERLRTYRVDVDWMKKNFLDVED